MATTRSTNRISGIFASLVVGLATAAACATGSGGGVGDDFPDDPDARVIDSALPIDAPVSTPDARPDGPVSMPDAATDGPIGIPDGPVTGACTTHTECGTGMCCFGMLMCVPGMAIPGFPPPFDCIPE